MSRVGDQINRLRIEKGLTRKQLAKMAGVSEGFMEEVEAGKKVLKDEMLSRITKILGKAEEKEDLELVPDHALAEEIKKIPARTVPKPVQQVWSDALESIMKTLPVHDYKMSQVISTRQLPVISNKVEGYAKDKVFYLKIEDNDMSGFRIMKDDLALAFSTQEIEREGIFFLEYNEKRVVRQIRKLEGEKLLLVSNRGSLVTETVPSKGVKILARLIKLEIIL